MTPDKEQLEQQQVAGCKSQAATTWKSGASLSDSQLTAKSMPPQGFVQKSKLILPTAIWILIVVGGLCFLSLLSSLNKSINTLDSLVEIEQSRLHRKEQGDVMIKRLDESPMLDLLALPSWMSLEQVPFLKRVDSEKSDDEQSKPADRSQASIIVTGSQPFLPFNPLEALMDDLFAQVSSTKQTEQESGFNPVEEEELPSAPLIDKIHINRLNINLQQPSPEQQEEQPKLTIIEPPVSELGLNTINLNEVNNRLDEFLMQSLKIPYDQAPKPIAERFTSSKPSITNAVYTIPLDNPNNISSESFEKLPDEQKQETTVVPQPDIVIGHLDGGVFNSQPNLMPDFDVVSPSETPNREDAKVVPIVVVKSELTPFNDTPTPSSSISSSNKVGDIFKKFFGEPPVFPTAKPDETVNKSDPVVEDKPLSLFAMMGKHWNNFLSRIHRNPNQRSDETKENLTSDSETVSKALDDIIEPHRPSETNEYDESNAMNPFNLVNDIVALPQMGSEQQPTKVKDETEQTKESKLFPFFFRRPEHLFSL